MDEPVSPSGQSLGERFFRVTRDDGYIFFWFLNEQGKVRAPGFFGLYKG